MFRWRMRIAESSAADDPLIPQRSLSDRLASTDAAIADTRHDAARAFLLLYRAELLAEHGQAMAAVRDLCCAFEALDSRALLHFVDSQRHAFLHNTLFARLTRTQRQQLLALADSDSDEASDDGDGDDDDWDANSEESETATTTSVDAVESESEPAPPPDTPLSSDAPPLELDASAYPFGVAQLVAELQRFVSACDGASPHKPASRAGSLRGSSVSVERHVAGQHGDTAAGCVLTAARFDPALCFQPLAGRSSVSVRRLLRFVRAAGVVHDELEAECLAMALRPARHARGHRSFVPASSIDALLYAVKSVSFANSPPYVQRLRLERGEFVVKACSVTRLDGLRGYLT